MTLTIEKIDTSAKKQVKRFVNLPYHLYANHPEWVPPLQREARRYLNRKKHYCYDHSEPAFRGYIMAQASYQQNSYELGANIEKFNRH
jgi:hypothetical protein